MAMWSGLLGREGEGLYMLVSISLPFFSPVSFIFHNN